MWISTISGRVNICQAMCRSHLRIYSREQKDAITLSIVVPLQRVLRPITNGDWRKVQLHRDEHSLKLRGQFQPNAGWDIEKRDERLDILVDIISRYAKLKIHALMRNDDFNELIKSLPAPKRSLSIDGPFSILANQLILAVAISADLYGITDLCDFIFDEADGFSAEFLAKWPASKQIADQQPRLEFGKRIGSTPIFGNEKRSLPLQAADMYAWNVRQNMMNNRVVYMPPPKLLKRLASVPSVERNYFRDEVVRLRAHLIRVGEVFWKDNPQSPKEYISANKRERKNARKLRKQNH